AAPSIQLEHFTADIHNRDFRAERGEEWSMPSASSRETQHPQAGQLFRQPSAFVYQLACIREVLVRNRMRMRLASAHALVPAFPIMFARIVQMSCRCRSRTSFLMSEPIRCFAR